MPYFKKNSLIMNKRRGGLAGWTDTVGDVAKGALTLFGAQQKAAGEADAYKAQLAAQQAAASGGGISTETVVIGGVALAAVAFLLLRKKAA